MKLWTRTIFLVGSRDKNIPKTHFVQSSRSNSSPSTEHKQPPFLLLMIDCVCNIGFMWLCKSGRSYLRLPNFEVRHMRHGCRYFVRSKRCCRILPSSANEKWLHFCKLCPNVHLRRWCRAIQRVYGPCSSLSNRGTLTKSWRKAGTPRIVPSRTNCASWFYYLSKLGRCISHVQSKFDKTLCTFRSCCHTSFAFLRIMLIFFIRPYPMLPWQRQTEAYLLEN